MRSLRIRWGSSKASTTCYTGKVERVDTELLQTLLNQGIVPVVPPLGFDGDGKTYRVNSDSIALAVAEALKATKLIFITAQDGLRYNGQLIRQMLVADLQKLIQSAKRRICAGNVFQGSPRGRRLRRRRASASTSSTAARTKGCSPKCSPTKASARLIYANEYEQIRPAKKKDIRAIQMLTKKAVEAGELVRRTRADIEKNLADYYIFEIDKNPVACVALHVYPGNERANSPVFMSIRRTKTRASAGS